MIRTLMIAVASAAVFTLSTTAFAQGTATEAKAMLEKGVAAVKADKAKALDTINKGEGGFLDRDLYVFCFNSGDGNIVATGSSNPTARKVLGQDVRTLKDATGKMYGADLYAAAKEGQITEVTYMFPKPGADSTPVAKVSFVTKVGDVAALATTSRSFPTHDSGALYFSAPITSTNRITCLHSGGAARRRQHRQGTGAVAVGSMNPGRPGTNARHMDWNGMGTEFLHERDSRPHRTGARHRNGDASC